MRVFPVVENGTPDVKEDVHLLLLRRRKDVRGYEARASPGDRSSIAAGREAEGDAEGSSRGPKDASGIDPTLEGFEESSGERRRH